MSSHLCTPELVQGIIAGGAAALRGADLEDRQRMETLIAQPKLPNWLVGITAGGTTPLSTAHSEQRDSEDDNRFIACVPVEQVSAEADIDIRLWWAGSTGWIYSPQSWNGKPSWR